MGLIVANNKYARSVISGRNFNQLILPRVVNEGL